MPGDEPKNIVDWLQLAFQFDHGEGHLECFSKTQPIEIDHQVCCELFIYAFVPVVISHEGPQIEPNPADQVDIHYSGPPPYTNTGLRAPPIVI